MERGVFVLGLVAIVVLGLFVVHLWRHRQTAVAVPATTSIARPGTTSTASPPATTTAERLRAAHPKRAVTAATTTSPAPKAKTVSLRLTAKADTWFEVRPGSATGRLLYGGTLSAGSSRGFHARALWVRFGAAGNLSARLDGKALLLPSGTYSAAFGGHGFRRLGG